jgi:hypothetical protein
MNKKKSMNSSQEQIAPDVIRILIANATANNLSINDYLRQLLGLKDEQGAVSPSSELDKEELPPNDTRLAALQRIAERQAKRPFTKSADTIAMLREARAGAMWGYDSTE